MCTWQHRDVYDVQSRQKNSQYYIGLIMAQRRKRWAIIEANGDFKTGTPADLASCQADDCVQAPLSQHDPIKSRLRHSWAVMWHVGTILDVHWPRVDRCHRFLPPDALQTILCLRWRLIRSKYWMYITHHHKTFVWYLYNVSKLYKCFCLLGR